MILSFRWREVIIIAVTWEVDLRRGWIQLSLNVKLVDAQNAFVLLTWLKIVSSHTLKICYSVKALTASVKSIVPQEWAIMVPAHRTVNYHFYAAQIAIHLLSLHFQYEYEDNTIHLLSLHFQYEYEDNMTDIVWEFSTINLLCETSRPLTTIEKFRPEPKPQGTKA
jgi:hypothetical protein